MTYASFVADVFEIMPEANELLLALQRTVSKIEVRRADFVTNADRQSNELIAAMLQSFAPEIPIYSEENESNPGLGRQLAWVVDPLDGTLNFYHQDSLWGISIALVDGLKTVLGVVSLPSINQIIAVTPEGAILARNAVLGVRRETKLLEAMVWLDWGKDSNAALSLLPRLRERSLPPQIRLCCTGSMIAVATGKIAGYVHPHPAPEDFSAAALIVEAAGGRVTDLLGNPWSVLSGSIVATNGLIHDELLKALAEN